MIRVVIADDHPLMRDGLRRILLEQGDIEIVGEAGTAEDLLSLVEAARPHLVVLDVTMPGPGLVDTLRRLANACPEAPVLVLSTHPEGDYALRALKSGARGYLTKTAAPSELVAAVRRVTAGGRYVSDALADRLASRVAGEREGPRHEALSDREFQVLRLLGNGKTIGDIARELDLSPKTVSTYRSRLLLKLDLDTTAELVRYAVEHGLAD